MKKTTNAEGQLTLAGTEEGEILAQLSERVEKAVRMIQELRKERDSLKAQLATASASQEDVERFTAERSEIRDRIAGILSSLDELDAVDE